MSYSSSEPPGKRLKLDDENAKAEVKTAGWSDLPNELKLMVISYTKYHTLSNFAQCSKNSFNLAVASGRLCSVLELTLNRTSSWWAPFVPDYELHFKRSANNYNYSSWCIRFCGSPKLDSISIQYIKHEKTFHQLTENGKFFEVISRYTKKYLQLYKDCLEEFHMNVRCQAKSNFIRGFKLPTMTKLRVLEISETARQYCLFKYNFVDFETVRRVRESLQLPSTQITFQQLIRLQAARIMIYLTDLTADNLNEYIKYWRDGKLSPNLQFIKICGGYSVRNPKRREVSINWDGLELEKREYDTLIRSNFDKTKCVSISVSTLYFSMTVCDVDSLP